MAAHLRNGTLTGYTSSNGRRPVGNRKPGGVNSSNHYGKRTNGRRHYQEVDGQGFRVHQHGEGKRPVLPLIGLQGVTFEELREGQKVSYTEGQGKKGPCAENVKPV